MKVFIIEFKAPFWTERGFLIASSQQHAIKWFAEASPVSSRIIKIREGAEKDSENNLRHDRRFKNGIL